MPITARLFLTAILVLVLGRGEPCLAQSEGRAALDKFRQWEGASENATLQFGQALKKYRETLRADGIADAVADRIIRLIEAHYEAELYNRVYSEPPEFNTRQNQLLAEAVERVRAGTALDVGMGQGRNAIYLATKGWTVTGFDVAEVGLRKAEEQAAAAGVRITTVLASDEEFEFGRDRWDLIAIIYAIEKRSVYRVRDALKPGGLVVIEAGHSETSGAPFEYGTNELLEIFQGFRILKYEDTSGTYDWGPERIRLVRLVAQKPR